MRAARSSSKSTDSVAALVAAVELAPDDAARAQAFCLGFDRLYVDLDLHPAESTASGMFESAAATARQVAADCLPLGLALVMHLYPLCALNCVPLPWWSPANLRRTRLMGDIRDHGLMLANAGSERVDGMAAPVTVTRTRGGILLDGTHDYVSLAHVADLVLFSVEDGGQAIFCAADICSPTARIGAGKFNGSMGLSDTCTVRFENHHVPATHFIEIPASSALRCTAQYQRSWFHLLLGEAHLARIERLYQQWELPRAPDFLVSLNELAFLRKYSLCLLEDAASPGSIDCLARVTAAMKLRVSLLAQSTGAAIRERDPVAAQELGYIRRQPTCDDRILASLGESTLEIDERQKLAS